MTKVDPDSSLERLLGLLEGHNSNLLHLLRAKTEQEFIVATEGAIERAMKTIENGSKEYSRLNEPGLSHLLADFLNLSGCRATAETNNNGHVDVVVECAFGRHWRYLGECKLHNGYKYHVDGCEQLLADSEQPHRAQLAGQRVVGRQVPPPSAVPRAEFARARPAVVSILDEICDLAQREPALSAEVEPRTAISECRSLRIAQFQPESQFQGKADRVP